MDSCSYPPAFLIDFETQRTRIRLRSGAAGALGVIGLDPA